MPLDLGSPRGVGQRCFAAREARGITPEVAAEHLGLSRPALAAIEAGERAPRPAEIVQLAQLYGRPVHWFARAAGSVPDLPIDRRAAVDRAGPAATEEIQRAIDTFRDVLTDYLDLERRLNAPLGRNDPPTLALSPGSDVQALAEELAARERRRLGLGERPIADLRSILESEAGVRIVLGALPGHLAAVTFWDNELGGCLLLNRDHPAAQRRLSIARAHGRWIVARSAAAVDSLIGPAEPTLADRFVAAFAWSFLMPAASVQRWFREVVAASGRFEVADLVRVQRVWHVPLEAMTRRLEGLDLLQAGTWDSLQARQDPDQAPADRSGLRAEEGSDPALPERYRFLAVRAFERGDLTEQELARYLRSDLWEARQQVKELLQSVAIDPDGQAHPLSVDFNTSLLAAPI